MEKTGIPALIKARLIKRVNRFVAEVLTERGVEQVYVPNTGRLSELALPGAEILLSPIKAKYRYKILYIINSFYPVMIDSTYSNRLFHELLDEKKVPSLEGYTLVRREPAYKNHRFDFLMKAGGDELFVELKSCTLFHGTTASFPDAVSSRAAGHVRLLAETGSGVLVFFILKEGMKKFIPNYHTDFAFYETLRDNRHKVKILALSVKYDENLRISGLCEVPVEIPDVSPGGIFIILLHKNDAPADQSPAPSWHQNGYYLLCGSDMENVFRAVEKFRRRREELPGNGKIIADIPVVSGTLTASDAGDLFMKHGGKPVGPAQVQGDFPVIYFSENPAEKGWFWDEILKLRFG